ncbi:MAG: hypothetical protein LBH98_07150 [Chitinispirillales bacterium]|jgi:hypothetical protein|nr:hypothetical protein [Chitinispirillales bacterium]
MTIVLTALGVFVCVILIMHTFITGNAIEKNCIKLRESIDKYYSKENNKEARRQE